MIIKLEMKLELYWHLLPFLGPGSAEGEKGKRGKTE